VCRAERSAIPMAGKIACVRADLASRNDCVATHGVSWKNGSPLSGMGAGDECHLAQIVASNRSFTNSGRKPDGGIANPQTSKLGPLGRERHTSERAPTSTRNGAGRRRAIGRPRFKFVAQPRQCRRGCDGCRPLRLRPRRLDPGRNAQLARFSLPTPDLTETTGAGPFGARFHEVCR